MDGRPPSEVRERFRAGLVAPTAGWSPGYAQANLIAISHAPGHMFITDVPDAAYAV